MTIDTVGLIQGLGYVAVHCICYAAEICDAIKYELAKYYRDVNSISSSLPSSHRYDSYNAKCIGGSSHKHTVASCTHLWRQRFLHFRCVQSDLCCQSLQVLLVALQYSTSINQSINQSIQKVLTPRRGQHCTNNNST